MIIQVRGTSGSGKSTVMREVIAGLGGKVKPVMREGRKNPLYYMIDDIAILGHYESPCGGCDTVGSARQVFDLLQEVEARIVLSEGLLLSEDTKWSKQLKDLWVVFLTTPVETCLERIRERRKKAGNNKPLSETNTRNRVAVIERARLKLVAESVICRRCSSNQAADVILNWIRLHADQEG